MIHAFKRHLRVSCSVIVLQAIVGTASSDIIHSARPGVGVFRKDPGIQLTVSETSDGYLAEIVFEENGGTNPTFRGSWKSDGWTRFYANEVTWEGEVEAPVEFSFDSFSEGPYAVRTDAEFRLPPTDGEYSVSAESAGIACLRCAPARVIFEYSVENIDPPLPGDFDFNDKVDLADFTILSSNFGHLNRSWKDGDATLDGLVDFADFLILSHNFGATHQPQRAAVPEPTTLALLVSAYLGLGVFRRRSEDATVAS